MKLPSSASSDLLPTASGEVFTFYSYKGGTGRSMLLANVAWLLAGAGSKVLLIDWDLEAPGLHRYFRPFLGDDPELKKQGGVIEWLTDYWDACLDDPQASVETLVRDYADPRHYVRPLQTTSYLAGGIDLLCAGRQDHSYGAAVADFDYTRLYEKLRGEEFIDVAKQILVGPGGYDYVLVDSRTGVSDTSGFCTVALADTLIVCFTYNNQSAIGASQIARDIKGKAEQRRMRFSLTPGHSTPTRIDESLQRSFRLFAVPSRVDDLDPDRLERRQAHAWGLFNDLLTDVPEDQRASYWVSVQIRNQGLFAYEEVLAVCMNRPDDRQSVLGAVVELTSRLTNGAIAEAPKLGDEQRRILRERFAELGSPTQQMGAHSAWRFFLQRVPDPGAREVVLQGCFPLLAQLFTTAPSSISGEPGPLVRTMLLESDLVADERQMAELLTSFGITQRRLTEDRQRGLMVADESILQHWQELNTRLITNVHFLALREHVRQARRGWEAGGRTITALRSLQGEFAQFQLGDEQQAWMGRPNLQLLHLIQEVRTIDVGEVEARSRLANVEAEYRSRLDDAEARFREMQQLYDEREQTLRAHSEELSIQTERTAKAQAEVAAVQAQSVKATLQGKVRQNQRLAAFLMLVIVLPLSVFWLFVEMPVRMRIEALFNAWEESSTINPSLRGATVGTAGTDVKRALGVVGDLGRGLSGKPDELQLALPGGVESLGFLPGVAGRREFFDRFRTVVESQVNGTLRLMLTNYPWPVTAAGEPLQAKAWQKTRCTIGDGSPNVDHRAAAAGNVGPAGDIEGTLYSAASLPGVSTRSSQEPRALIVSTPRPDSLWDSWEIREGNKITRCVAGAVIWSSPPTESRPAVAFDATLHYLLQLTFNESQAHVPEGTVSVDELTWLRGPADNGWVVGRRPVAMLRDPSAVGALQAALGSKLHMALDTVPAPAGIVVALSREQSWRLVSSVSPLSIRGIAGAKLQKLEEVANDHPCARLKPQVKKDFAKDGAVVNNVSTYAHGGYCAAIARVLPAQGYVPSNQDVVLVSVYLPPRDDKGAARQIASMNFGFQPQAANRWLVVDEGPYAGWIALDVGSYQNGGELLGAPWSTGAVAALGKELLTGAVASPTRGVSN